MAQVEVFDAIKQYVQLFHYYEKQISKMRPDKIHELLI